MPYVINVESRADGPASAERQVVNTSRLTIGRGDECSVRLVDPKKHVSRVHAVIDLEGKRHLLTVVSRVNPVVVNGTKIAPADSAPVKADDVIEIGDFSIRLLEMHESAPTPGASSAREIAPSPFDFGLGRSGDTVPGDDPFRALDDLVPQKPAPRPPVAGPDPFEMAPAAKTRRADPNSMVDGLGGLSARDLGNANESTDPLANLLAMPDVSIRSVDGPTFNPQQPLGGPALDALLAGGMVNAGGSPLVDLARHHPGGSSSIDHVQALSVAYNAPQVRREARQPAPEPVRTPPRPAAPAPGADPFEGFDPFGSLIKPRAAEAAREPEVDLSERTAPPVPMARAAPPAPALPAAPAPAPASSGRELAAFLEGAGLGLQIPPAEAEKFMRESGAIVRAAVEGLIGLLMARSEMKKEMRAEERTMVASRDNNPLKLMTDPSEAIRYLFDVRERVGGAFLPPIQAVADACDDLRVHEIALMAGMRAAFQGALKRFAPQYIEREADKQNGGFTLNKKVKLWDAFVAHHEKLSRDAEDDLLKVFGKEFLSTYAAQVRRLRSGR
jgi:type VI secretion system FHA domain protein